MHKTHIDLSLKTRQAVIKILNARLADAVDLGIQAKMAHWNVRGPNFIALHELFDKVAAQANDHADAIAERIAALGGVVRGNLQETVKATSLGAFGSDLSKEKDVLKALAQGMATFANLVRKEIDAADELGDMVTSDMLTEVAGETDKYLWFVEAHLQ